MINEFNAFSCSGFDRSPLHGAVHRFLFVYEPVFLVLRCHVFYDKKPLCYSYDRVTSLISNFLELNIERPTRGKSYPEDLPGNLSADRSSEELEFQNEQNKC